MTRYEVFKLYENEINSMPEKTRAIFMESFVHGLTVEQIAKQLYMTVDTVRVHLHNAKMVLKSKDGLANVLLPLPRDHKKKVTSS